MNQQNGYFKLTYNPDKSAICSIIPPVEGGTPLAVKELTAFLDKHGFAGNYDIKSLDLACKASTQTDVALRAGDGYEFNEDMNVFISEDKMSVVARFYPPSGQGKKNTAASIISDLGGNKIKYGVDQDAILAFVKNPVYCTDVVLAKGLMPVQGRDAYIEYFFDTDLNTIPAKNEDGTVDFKNINTVAHVFKGDKLAELHPEDRGKSGMNVFGQEINPRPVKGTRLSFGRNIKVSEDKLTCYSEVTGHARLYNGQIFVSDVLEIPANVDNSTGNINYEGNVHIKGSVREGFEVVATGDVIVDGSVEGAMILSKGQIIVARGINGMNKGVLQADGNIIVKFIENATVISGGYVDSGSIIHSTVSAYSDIIVENQKGFITGSTVKSGSRVEVQTLGSAMGAATTVEVGIDPAKKEEYNNISKEINAINEELAKITPIIKNYAAILSAGKQLDEKNQQYYVKLLQMLKAEQEKLAPLNGRMEVLQKEINAANSAKVVVKRDVFPGVNIIISDVSLSVKEKRSFCEFVKELGDVRVKTL